MTTFTATLPDGTTATANSGRTWTHAVAVQRKSDNVWYALSWSGSEAGAAKSAASLRAKRPGIRVAVVPVD